VIARPRSTLAVLALVIGPACAPSSRLPRARLEPAARPLRIRREIVSFRMDSGLRVALVPDARTNLVSVDVRYTTGAIDDPPHRSGLAHLAEHVSFGIAGPGGATVAQRLDQAALVYSAYTSWDETHFASLALAARLDELLAIEASRMAARCDRVAPEVIERERDVVDNEMRERDMRGPWGPLAARLFPADHPYVTGAGGADLDAIGRDDVCRFLAGRYAPAGAILVVGGAVDPRAARELISRRLGAIRRSDQAPRRLPAAATVGESILESELDQPTAVIAFPAQPRGLPGQATRDLAIDLWKQRILELGRTAGVRDVERGFLGGERGGIDLLAITGRDAGVLRQVVDAAFAARDRLLDADFSIERRNLRALRVNEELAALDRFEGLGARVADAIQHAGSAEALLAPIDELEALWPDRIDREVESLGLVRLERFVDRGAGSIRLGRGIAALPDRRAAHVAYLLPGRAGRRASRPDGARRIDLAEWRAPVDPAEAERPLPVPAGRPAPRVHELLLESGLRVLLAPVPGSAVFEARLVFPAGLVHEPAGLPGVAALAALLLEHDMSRRYAEADLRRASWALGLGTRVTFEVGAASTVFRISGAARYADWHAWRLFWLVRQGVYTDEALARVRGDGDGAPRDDRAHRLRRALAGALLGGVIVREQGADTLRRIDRREIESFRRAAFVPGGATLIVTGGFDIDRMRAEIETLADGWSGRPAARRRRPTRVSARGPQSLALVDGESRQVSIALAFPASDWNSAARLVAAEMVDAQARAIRRRIGATYGIHAEYAILASAAPALLASGDADPARAGEVLIALLTALDDLRGGGEVFRRAFILARRRVLGRVLARVADSAALAAELETLARVGWPTHRRVDLVAEVAALTPAAVAHALAADLDRDKMVVAIAGSHAAVEAAFRTAGLAGVRRVP
jgi:zinc protease